MSRNFRPLPELIQRLHEVSEAARDEHVVYPALRATGVVDTHITDDGVSEVFKLGVAIDRGNGETTTLLLEPQAVPQLCVRADPKSAGQAVPASYIDALTADPHNADAVGLAVINLNHWLERCGQPKHRGGMPKRILVRSLLTPEGSGAVRALLSDSYLAIDSLSVLTTALQVAQNKFNFESKGSENPAAGAVAIDWRLSRKAMDVCFANPTVAFDLKHPERGVFRTGVETGEGAHAWLRAAPDNDGSMPVIPACRITNSETGHGGLTITNGYYERICANTAFIGQELTRRHIGKISVEGEESDRVRRAGHELIFASIADATRIVFDTQAFEQAVRKFHKLFTLELPLENVKSAAEHICKIGKISPTLLDSIMMAYRPIEDGKHTLGDIQRAITNVAHWDSVSDEMEATMEDVGGQIVERGLAFLGAAAPKQFAFVG